MTKKSLLHRTTARFRNNPYYAKLLEVSGKPIREKKWVFITGCYNSGTTLLNEVLARHPQISGLPDEGVMLTDQLSRPEDFGWRRMWCQCREDMETWAGDPERIKRHWSHFYDASKPFFLEKSISNNCRLPYFNRHFQPAYFIHIIRNGYAVAEGIHRKAKVMEGNPYQEQEHYPIALCARQWVASLKEMEQHRKDLSNLVEITYEQLTEDPEKVVNGILEFLGLSPFSPGFFETSFAIHEKQSAIRNMNPSSFKRLSRETYAKINAVAGDELRNYGYEIRES